MGRPKAKYNEAGEKQCSKCGEFKAVVQFQHAKRNWDGLSIHCKACHGLRHKLHPPKRVPLDQRKRLPRTPVQDDKKLCTKCRQWLPLIDYYKHNQSPDGLHPCCITCHKARRMALSRQRGVPSREQRRTPYNEKGERLCKRCNRWLLPQQFPEDKSKWDGHHTTCKECCCRLGAEKRAKATPEIRALSAVTRREYYANNLQYRLKMNLKNRIWFALNGVAKSAHTLELIGCTIEELKVHLEKQFTQGMTWDNHSYEGWHIDHIRPCASFDLTDPEQQKQCFNYTNLQPMWAKENMSKGDKYEQKEQHGPLFGQTDSQV